MTRSRFALAALLSGLLSAIALGAGAGSAADADDPTALKTPATTVHSKLVDQLQANPTGGVDAVVTAWSRTGLDEVSSIVQGASLRTMPMVLTKSLTLAQLERLKASGVVRSVYPNTKFKLQMEDSTWITKARYVWASSSSGGPQAFGVTGANVELAVIDTGIDGQHEDADNLVEFCETTGAALGSRTEVLCSPFNPASGNAGAAGACGTAAAAGLTNPNNCFGTGLNAARTDSQDDDGHGSHVSGTVAGTGHASGGTVNTHSTIGMSPHAKLRVYSANVGPALANFEILAAFDDLTFKKENGLNRVVAVNNSWGGGDGSNYDPADPQSIAFKRAYDAGILLVFAAGNSGWEHDTLSGQCVSPWVACVAASTKPDSIVMFSSRGRPSQPTDTNRDGQITAADVEPDNHDRRLGQALNLGVYRPTLAAPGVNINSISANAAGCRELLTMAHTGCYEQLNGTSMASPHVTGAVGLIVQAYRQGHSGNTPSPATIIDILERSANTAKLPAWDSEEQGAGRLDVHQSVRYARGATNLPRPNLGHPTPPYVANDYPKGPDQDPDFSAKGCTAAGSWTLGDIESPAPNVPPATTYGQHFITVQPKTERLRITVRWEEAANLYVRLWRPGVDPSSDVNPAGPTRTFPDNESIGLLEGTLPFLGPERLIEVRSPEAGVWTLRVYHRAGEASSCGTTDETPPQPVRSPAVEYDVLAELPRVTHQPLVTIESPNGNTTGRFVEVRGRAGYPPHASDPPPINNVGHSWEGVTNWEVPGSSGDTGGDGGVEPNPDNRPVLYFHGNRHNAGEPGEANALCQGKGRLDVSIVGCGPFLLPSSALQNTLPAASWTPPVSPLLDGVADRNIYDPNFTWCLATGPACPGTLASRPGPTTVEGPMTVEWWASTAPAGSTPGLFTMGWTIRLWADGALKFTSGRIEATPAVSVVPSRLKAVVFLPTIRAEQRFVLHVDANEVDIDQEATDVYYDSQSPALNACADRGTTGPPAAGLTVPTCDSLVKMPVVTNGGGGGGGGSTVPQNVRVTDLPAGANYPAAPQTPALRVAWDEVTGATEYWVYRSTNPTSLGSRVFRGAGTPCTSPEAPGNEVDSQPGHDRPGRCFTNTGLSLLTTYYYRVLAVTDNGQGELSNIASGTPTRYDRQVKLKVDRLYGPQHWEYALVSPSPTPSDTTNTGVRWTFLWDTLELSPGQHDLFARSFTQGIGSQKAQRTLGNDQDPPPPPPNGGCPDDDDGDDDDDEDDGDRDDDGDDDDDDCEDDDDDEEEDDD
jgi:serine protease AprX